MRRVVITICHSGTRSLIKDLGGAEQVHTDELRAWKFLQNPDFECHTTFRLPREVAKSWGRQYFFPHHRGDWFCQWINYSEMLTRYAPKVHRVEKLTNHIGKTSGDPISVVPDADIKYAEELCRKAGVMT